MVRKRLEDLVREEAQKSLKPENEAASAEQTIELEATVVPETDNDHSLSGAKRATPTKADLETTLKELKAALQAAEEDNSSWQQQTATLQSDLQEQKTLVEKLQLELSQAKQLILKITESNSVPPQKENPQPSPKENKSIKPQNLKPQNLSLRTKTIPYHSMQASSPPTEMTNSDIGWFD